ncbi:hypothetical protein [Caulobacter sp. NIBR1757]|uniref:VgrG-related protein n=1 Tax=Caulobacter sp. NIBR1757 TaxID=3016000 RepID=UPI0022F02CF7|nr:hypothetical protein [Caulobacter sp. NIBR1757]
MAEALPHGARKVFDMLTLPREGGFMAAVAARAGERVQEARRAVSLERQALGVDEYHVLIEAAPEQAMAALGSASGELAARLRESGAGQAEIQAAQRELVSQAKVQRIETVLAADPQRAAGLLQDEPMIGDAERSRLADDISLEIRRRQVRGEVAAMAAEHERLADEPEAFLRRVLSAGGEDADLYAGAAIGEIRVALARRTARDEAAWNAVSPLLDSGEVRTWTDLPSGVWRRLSSEQQQQVRDRLDQTMPLAAEGPLLVRANLAPGETGESLLVRAAFQPAADPGLSWGFGDNDRQTLLTAQDKAVNLALSKRPFDDGLIVDAKTGQVVRPRIRARPGLSLQAGKGDFEVVTNYEAQQFRERRLGALSHKAGMMSPEEQTYRRENFSDVKEDAAPAPESQGPHFRDPINPALGDMSRLYEVGKRGPDHIQRTTGDVASYGLYQFTKDTARDFVRSPEATGFADLFAARPGVGTPEYDAAWKAAAARDPEGFGRAQRDYFRRGHYDPFIAGMKRDYGIDIGQDSYAMQDVLWSTRVHHGVKGAPAVLKAAIAKSGFLETMKGLASLPEKDRATQRARAQEALIAEIYKERGKADGQGGLAYFPGKTHLKKGLLARFKAEAADALAAHRLETGLR